MIKKGIPIYILPSERECGQCIHANKDIKSEPCIDCGNTYEVNPLSKWELQPDRKIGLEINTQRIEQLEFMVLDLQRLFGELGFGLEKQRNWSHNT